MTNTKSAPTYKEYLIFGLLCLLALSAGIYLTYRANRFDPYYEERAELDN